MFRQIASVGSLTLLSRISGFIRDIVIASVLGAGWMADAFVVAQRLPNHFRAIFGEGAFNAAFVPAYARQLEDQGSQAARLFASGAAALRGELSLLNGEYALLRHMNDAAATNYAHLADVASGLTVFADALAAKDASLAPYLHMIDAIDSQVGELEAVVSTLDNYTRRLESRVRALHDRH